mmetsp:Transcript_18001/g.46515  ORF Transcript_18001/g.46515 Transcript_18001/m.46515 type:complete len:89 (-) Transcript_18001:83-349(-)
MHGRECLVPVLDSFNCTFDRMRTCYLEHDASGQLLVVAGHAAACGEELFLDYFQDTCGGVAGGGAMPDASELLAFYGFDCSQERACPD